MGRVEDLEKAVEGLSSEDLREFRRWFFEFDAELWDRQLERDVAEGKLDSLIDEALEDHRHGHTRPL